jgi:anti-sigma regulatory factor (Ser/Thr protein kinase)
MAEPGGELSHAAYFYHGQADCAAAISAFVGAGLAAGEPAMIALPGAKTELIGAHLDAAPGELVRLDMAELGRNPARIIPEVRAFTDKHPGQRVRFVGEPIWPGRSAAEIREATRHEALLNLAFAQVPVSIFCPYDASALSGSVLAGARGTHPEMAGNGHGPAAAAAWTGGVPEECDRALGAPPAGAQRLAYETDLASVRRLAGSYARQAGLGEERAGDLVIAANEIAANTICHTGGGGVLHIWHTPEEVVCQLQDSGWIADPLAGRARTGPDDRGHGLWLVNQVCDLVELRSGPGGTTIRLHMRLSAA